MDCEPSISRSLYYICKDRLLSTVVVFNGIFTGVAEHREMYPRTLNYVQAYRSLSNDMDVNTRERCQSISRDQSDIADHSCHCYNQQHPTNKTAQVCSRLGMMRLF